MPQGVLVQVQSRAPKQFLLFEWPIELWFVEVDEAIFVSNSQV